ncbi:UNVERIFIED_CONTAM: hypothetical protein K2H54_025715 [Gekko kuhli]
MHSPAWLMFSGICSRKKEKKTSFHNQSHFHGLSPQGGFLTKADQTKSSSRLALMYLLQQKPVQTKLSLNGNRQAECLHKPKPELFLFFFFLFFLPRENRAM